MQIEKFKAEFKQLNGVPFGQTYVLFRKPLELMNLNTGETVQFEDLDEALRYEIEGSTLEKHIEGWTQIEFRLDGGRGGGSGLGNDKTFKFGHASGGGAGNGKAEKKLPVELNIKVPINNKSPEAVLEAFRELHVKDKIEYGATVDEYGFVTRYVQGDATSVGIWGGKGEMVYHNHPSGGAFSDSDLLSVSMTPAKGIVASGKNGDYIFVKGGHFKAQAFMKAVKNATLKGKDYSDAADKWLTKNQKKYGYKYVFKKAKS